MTAAAGGSLAERVIRWQAESGRHDLPWQHERTPYRVWLSEIMLQQTQVATVIPYFERFTESYPAVSDLAAAPIDHVLHLWSGLGYYSRARNLHRTAQRVISDYGGEFPADLEALQRLPGIGRSTAGAIMALAFEQPAAILDGNVKRVLARFHEVAGWPGETRVLKQLWALAESHLPKGRYRDYTQALMDLGATVCTRNAPACNTCPLGGDCGAHARDTMQDYPGRKPRRALPLRETAFLIIENADGELLLERRPERGVWGGLWCFPEADAATLPTALAAHLADLGVTLDDDGGALEPFTHTFTHFRLRITPHRVRATPSRVGEQTGHRWARRDALPAIGLPRPVTKLLQRLD